MVTRKRAMFVLLLVQCLGLAASRGFFDSHSNEEDMCRAATKAGNNDFYEVVDFVQSRGTNRPLVDHAGGSIGRARNSLAKGCSVAKGPNNTANQAVNKLLFKRLMVSEWLAANCGQLGLEFDLVRQLNPTNHEKTMLDVVREKRGQIAGDFVRKRYKKSRDFMAEFKFFQFNSHEYLVRPVCWEEQGEHGFNEISIIMEKLEPVRYSSELSNGGSALSSGNFLYSFASQSGDFEASFNMMARLAAQLLSILVHIHANGFVHGDLKSDNVALVEENREYKIKLIDYDLSARLQLVRAHAGTRLTMAPEVVGAAAGPLHEGADWWSYGVTLMWWASNVMQGLANKRKDNYELNRWKKWRPELWDHHDFVMDNPAMAQSLPPKLCCFLMNFIIDSPKSRRFNTKAEILGLMKSSFFESVDWNSIVRQKLRKVAALPNADERHALPNTEDFVGEEDIHD